MIVNNTLYLMIELKYNVDADKYCKSIELLSCNNTDSQIYSVFDDRTDI